MENQAKNMKQAVGVLAISGVIGSLLITVYGFDGRGSEAPDFITLFPIGMFAILMTCIALMAIGRIVPLTNKRIFVVTGLLSAVIAMVKFVFAPLAMYSTEYDTQYGDPNNSGTQMFIAIVICLLYLGAISIMAGIEKSRVNKKLGTQSPNRKPRSAASAGAAIGLGVASVVVLGFGGIVFLFVGGGLVLSSFTGSWGFFVLMFLLIAIVLCLYLFRIAGDESVRVGNMAALSTAIWLVVCVVAMYQIMWVILMSALVSVWPFKTFTSK